MHTIRMQMSFDVPIELVWEALTDYEGYKRFPGVTHARVLARGQDHPAGVGARREVSLGGATLVEEIVEFDPPHRLGYRIVESRPLKLAHDIGRMELTSRGNHTDLEWTTTFGIGPAVLGPLLVWPMGFMMKRTLMGILRFVKSDLEGRARAAAATGVGA